MKTLKTAALVVLSLVVAEAGLQVFTYFHEDVPDSTSYIYVPYVDHVRSAKHDGAPDGFIAATGQDRGGPAIWFLGGSTMYGEYCSSPQLPCEPEEPCSIPSHFNSILAERGLRYSGWNLGQPAYNSSQERILLQEMLFKHERPKIAVFYDGVNELGNTQIVGYPDEYRYLMDGFTKRLAWSDFWGDLSTSRLKTPFLLDFLVNSEDFLDHPGPPTEPDFNPFHVTVLPFTAGPRTQTTAPAVLEKAAREVADRYIHNVRLSQATCDAFDIRCVFLWQPTVCTKAHRTEREQSLANEWCAGYANLQREVLRLIRADTWIKERGNFYDLTMALGPVEDETFYDWCHIDEATQGSRIIASAIFDLLLRRNWL